MTATLSRTDAFALLDDTGAADSGWALFVDVDGTLLEIARRPDAVTVAPAIPPLLARLHTVLGGALALISGRTIADIDRLLAPLRFPVAGIHGGERRDAVGTVHTGDEASLSDELRARARAFGRDAGGLLVEDKGRAVALHYREAPEREAAVRNFAAAAVSEDRRLERVDGKMIVELRLRGADKGAAIAAFMAEAPFRGRRPVFVGDDVTDEDGFRVVNEQGGLSIRVGEAGASLARYTLRDVGAVRDWLARLAENLDGSSGDSA